MDTFNLVTSSWEAIYKQSQNRKEACSDFWLNSRDYLRKISQTLEALIRATGSSGRPNCCGVVIATPTKI